MPTLLSEFMERLVAEKRFGDLQPDGWHYPPIRKLRRHRPPRKQMTANKRKTEESIADEPEPRKTWPGELLNWSKKVTRCEPGSRGSRSA